MDTYEKKYKEALGWMQSLYNGLHGKTKEEAERYFPELKESEGEMIRKFLIQMVQNGHGGNKDWWNKCVTWLEKQGKQKPAWSEEDEEMCQETIDWFKKKCFPYALEHENPARESIKWLKSLKQRIEGE